MKVNVIDLLDGSRIEAKVNFGTIYYMQKRKGFSRIAKKAEKKKLSDYESMEMAATIVYGVLRSNGKPVTFDEALALVPPDLQSIKKILNSFAKEYEKYSKKKQAKQSSAPK